MCKKACFTGHRPQKLPWGFNEQDERCYWLKNKIRLSVEKAIADDYDFFISGMALGCDTYFSEIVLELKKMCSHIKLECAIPFSDQPAKWKYADKERYYEILEKCDKVTLLSKPYYRDCLMERNKHMVNNSNLLIAAYVRNETGGTKNTLEYAKGLGKDIVSILI